MSFEVTTEQFKGPLAVLLDVIQAEKLDITDVSLAKITEDYIGFIQTSKEISPNELADFLVVASKLLYLKSKLLLPELVADEEEEGIGLADQLRMYQKYAEASVWMGELLNGPNEAYYGKRMAIEEVPSFVPPAGVSKEDLSDVMSGVIQRLRPYVSLPERMMERVVSVEEKIEHFKQRIGQKANAYFHEMTNKASRADVVTSFLALLELLKQNIVRVDQTQLFEDISIERV